METWDLIKSAFSFIIIPLLSIIAYFGKSQLDKIRLQESRLVAVEREIAVMQSEMQTLVKDIVEIKSGINKLVDRLIK